MLNRQFDAFVRARGYQKKRPEDPRCYEWMKRVHETAQDLTLWLDPPRAIRWNYNRRAEEPEWNPTSLRFVVSGCNNRRAQVVVRGSNKAIVLFDDAERSALSLATVYGRKDKDFKVQAKAMLNTVLQVQK